MSTVAFFPWVAFESAQNYGEFQLLPFRRGRAPAGRSSSDQAAIDQIMEPYRLTPKSPVEGATVLTHAGRSDILGDLSEDDIANYFVFSELLAFSALSIRDYFTHNYTNRDAYRLVVQNFRAESRSVAVVSRRRDGTTTSLFTTGAFTEFKPHHVNVQSGKVDARLLDALVKARTGSSWGRLYEGIVNFNLANTDSSQMWPYTEAVLTIGALQRLLDCRGADADELVDRFEDLFRPSSPKSPDTCGVESTDPQVSERLRRAKTVSEGWLRDFYALRGSLAHGKVTPHYPSVWSLHEHLLLSAFLFPRLVKMALSKEALYSLSTTDKADIDLFEELACARHFQDTTDGEEEHLWRRIRNPIRLAMLEFEELLGGRRLRRQQSRRLNGERPRRSRIRLL